MPRPDAASAATTARALLERAVASRLFPAAVAEVGSGSETLWRCALGNVTFEPGARPTTPETIFDLASLTKPIVTLSVALDLAESGRLDLNRPIGSYLTQWRGQDRAGVTAIDLLEHASGLPARLLDRSPASRLEFLEEICATPLEYVPRSQSIYSDLGFLLLGFLVESLGGASLAVQFAALRDRLCPGALLEMPLATAKRSLAAPTWPLADDRRHGRMLQGEVHDSYASALGGVAGHAGLFGTAVAIGLFARALLAALAGDTSRPAPAIPSILRRATTRSAVVASSRALGWDTMLPSSSCGAYLSHHAFGHVGFTGTSLWIDPPADRYYVLLTNRVCDGGTLDDMRTIRRAFHEAWTAPSGE